MSLDSWQIACLFLYCFIVAVLSLYGFHRWFMLTLYFKHRGEKTAPRARFSELPGVTVQLPLYNEYHVVDRLLTAVGRLDYPRDRLQVQVLDDSVDETQERARQAVERLAGGG